jgi:hypothetical protein
MISYFREAPVFASVDDVLDRLERDNRGIAPLSQPAKESDEQDLYVGFYSRRDRNRLSIYTDVYSTPPGKLGPRQPLGGEAVICFEGSRVTDNRSLVKGTWASEDIVIEKMFLERWARLGMTFGMDWGKEANRELSELEFEIQRETGVHWGWTDWKVDENSGLRLRYYGLVPNSPEARQPASEITEGTLRNELAEIPKVLQSPALQNALVLYIHNRKKSLTEIARETGYKSANSLATLISAVRRELIRLYGEERTRGLLPPRVSNSSWRKTR